MSAPIQSINPATDEVVSAYQPHTNDMVQQRLNSAVSAFHQWKTVSMDERSWLLQKAAEILLSRMQQFARLMACEMGKPVLEGGAEAEKCAWVCRYYAENASAFLAPELIGTEAHRSCVTFQPLGPLLAVMPWNFPFWQVFRCAAPAVMAGNPVLLKHASNVPGCALAIEEIFTEAGFPSGMFSTLLIDSSRAEELIEDPRIAAVTLTGSVGAGRAVAARAGRALKKTVLELGGSDPYLVLEDAVLEAAAEACATARMINGGQSCIAGKRFIVVESVREQFETLLCAKMNAREMGDPLQSTTRLGPLAQTKLREDLHSQVTRSLEKGARLLTGGFIPEGIGAFYPPTVLTSTGPGMAVWDEETFGPVAAVAGAPDEATAIAMANDSRFGLGAAVFTSDLQRGEKIATEALEAGACFVNTYVRSDPRLPFGGIKDSGYGRELSRAGILEFVNRKTVYIERPD